MMPVYVLREGLSNVFLVHRTLDTADDVLDGLCARSQPRLNIFEAIEMDQDVPCESFLRRDLSQKRIDRGNESEFYEIDPMEMLTIVRRVRSIFAELIEDREAVGRYASETSTDRFVEPCDGDEKLRSQLLRNKQEQEYLAFEFELLQNKLKRRIGNSSGIRGLATWKTQVSRMYSEEIFRNSDPELYQELLERYYCLDTKAWRKNRPDQYKEIQTTYFSPRTCRAFKFLPTS
jgi:hypothetical protein